MITTKIKTIHEEKYSTEDKAIGILINYEDTFENQTAFKESFVYIYKKGMYIIFDTMIDMFDYLLNGDVTTNRAYIEESDFDNYYDSPFTGTFTEKLEWVNEG